MNSDNLIEKLELVKHVKTGLGAIFFTIFLITMVILSSIFLFETETRSETSVNLNWFEGVGMVILVFFLHEVLHALGFLIFGKLGIKSLRFGFDFKHLNLYCGINTPVTIRIWRIVLILPFIFSFCISFYVLAYFFSPISIFLVALAIGICHKDLFFWYLLRQYNSHFTIESSGEIFKIYDPSVNPLSKMNSELNSEA